MLHAPQPSGERGAGAISALPRAPSPNRYIGNLQNGNNHTSGSPLTLPLKFRSPHRIIPQVLPDSDGNFTSLAATSDESQHIRSNTISARRVTLSVLRPMIQQISTQKRAQEEPT